MQVFVLRTDLPLSIVPVIASYPPFPIIPREYHGTEAAVLSLPEAAVVTDPETSLTTLVGDWRVLYVDQVVNDEARRRIDEQFAEYMQRNALWAVQYNITRYGLPPSIWGTAEQEVYATAEQGWNYISDVRQYADAMVSNMPPDPTADANWPTRIPPVYIPF